MKLNFVTNKSADLFQQFAWHVFQKCQIPKQRERISKNSCCLLGLCHLIEFRWFENCLLNQELIFFMMVATLGANWYEISYLRLSQSFGFLSFLLNNHFSRFFLFCTQQTLRTFPMRKIVSKFKYFSFNLHNCFM